MSRRPTARHNRITHDIIGPAMVQVSLKDFVQTGRFGPVALGQSRAELRAHLGEPDDLGGTSRRHHKPRIWKLW